MKVLENLNDPVFPLKWADTEQYRKSQAFRKEIYLKDDKDVQNELIYVFYKLFGVSKSELLVYNKRWWQMCLSVWDINSDEYNFDLGSMPDECQAYLSMLKDSGIPVEYTGLCKCNDWDQFLPIVLRCVLTGEAPYSPFFVNTRDDLFFYFHHTGCIGIYYKDEENKTIKHILHHAHELYDVRD